MHYISFRRKTLTNGIFTKMFSVAEMFSVSHTTPRETWSMRVRESPAGTPAAKTQNGISEVVTYRYLLKMTQQRSNDLNIIPPCSAVQCSFKVDHVIIIDVCFRLSKYLHHFTVTIRSSSA